MKDYKRTLAITTLITLLPCLFGILLWNRLPDQIPTHFNFQNEIDGYSSKPFTVFGIPLMMAGMQFVCAFATLNDPRKTNMGKKVIHLILYIIPACSILVLILSYGTALGYPLNAGMITNVLLGLLFLVIGNYLPKIRQNYTMGIKLPWTLHSEANWNKTHRMAGWLWILGGLLMLVNAFLQSPVMLFVIIMLSTLIPGIYSFLLYKKETTD